jgi:ketosteroid isomerase-like protein
MPAKAIVLRFIDRINTHDVGGLALLMSDDHTFIDAHGNQVSGKAQMTEAWRAYFEWFPDYRIEITDAFELSDSVALFGFAGGSFRGKETEGWRLPVALKAIVKDDCVTLWQVFADTKIPLEIIERNG